MKKADGINGVSEDEMIARADELTEESKDEAMIEHEAAWDRVFDRAGYYGKSRTYEAIFEELRGQLVNLQKNMAEGLYAPIERSLRHELKEILAFDFTYTYDVFEWNRKGFDPDDMSNFDSTETCDESLDYDSQKLQIVQSLFSYITFAAALARKSESGSYEIWRKALIDCEFKFSRFVSGAVDDEVDAFFDEIQAANQMLWADCRINAKMDELLKNGCKGKKKGALRRI